MSNYETIEAGNGKFIRAWKRGVPFDDNTIEQLKATARLPFVRPYVAAMPDAHLGSGSTIGTVMPTVGAVAPAAVGVDIGCGMLAQRLTTSREFLGDLARVRATIERAVPHGRTNEGKRGDRGAWFNIPAQVHNRWNEAFSDRYEEICRDDAGVRAYSTAEHLGTLGTGNHFIELAEDEHGAVWLVLHSGSRGLGNKIGSYFTRLAQENCERDNIELPHRDLAYLRADSSDFVRYKASGTVRPGFCLGKPLDDGDPYPAGFEPEAIGYSCSLPSQLYFMGAPPGYGFDDYPKGCSSSL